MADIVIAVLAFPNDPTNNITAHQMFISEYNGTQLNLYSISSILGKEKRVYGPDKDDYLTIIHPEYLENGFKSPSFIDCTKMYSISIDNSVDISKLTNRVVDPSLKQRILNKINDKKREGKLTVYNISLIDFKSWNSRL
jgi:hypothetical protein